MELEIQGCFLFISILIYNIIKSFIIKDWCKLCCIFLRRITKRLSLSYIRLVKNIDFVFCPKYN